MAKKPPKVTAVPETPNVPDHQREALSTWMKERLEEMQEHYELRIQTLRTVGEHPSPLMSKYVRTFAGLGLSNAYIARLCNTSTSTIERHYESDIELGKAETVAMVATNAVRIATSLTDPAASKVALAILDRRGGEDWKPPTKRVEMGDIEKPKTLDTSALSFDEREELRQLMLKMAGVPPQLERDEGEDI